MVVMSKLSSSQITLNPHPLNHKPQHTALHNTKFQQTRNNKHSTTITKTPTKTPQNYTQSTTINRKNRVFKSRQGDVPTTPRNYCIINQTNLI
jgi:hypothetical protein